MTEKTVNFDLSVIVISFNKLDILEKCLLALEKQKDNQNIEIIVIRNWQNQLEDYHEIQEKFPQIKSMMPTDNCDIPKMRQLAMLESQGNIIALIEDDCLVSENWCSAIVEAHNKYPEVAIGGAIEPSKSYNALDWGVYFCEYVRFMSPFAGEVQALPGNNVSYKRAFIEEILQDNQEGFYEVLVHQNLLEQGKTLRAEPKIFVYNFNSWNLSNLLRVPFNHGRGFAYVRSEQWPLSKRLIYIGVSVLLPFIFVSRIVVQVLKRKKSYFNLIQALPSIILFSSSWSLGELNCYLFGRKEEALNYWK